MYEPIKAQTPAIFFHWHFHLQPLPETAVWELGFLAFPFNDRQGRFGLLQLLHFALLDGFVLH